MTALSGFDGREMSVTMLLLLAGVMFTLWQAKGRDNVDELLKRSKGREFQFAARSALEYAGFVNRNGERAWAIVDLVIIGSTETVYVLVETASGLETFTYRVQQSRAETGMVGRLMGIDQGSPPASYREIIALVYPL